MSIDLAKLTVADAGRLLRGKEISAKELTTDYLARIAAENSRLNVYLEVFDDALSRAEEIDERRARGQEIGPLGGIPLAFKDNILIAGKKVSAASRILEGYRASYSATVTEKLSAAGAIILGRTNMDEFAMGASTENSAYGPTKNPHDPARVPGGSSGGSAAAVAADLALAALGSDTGGSIRQPASFCGVVGLKPTYGRVSRFGLIALASSLDQIGPLAKTVADAELIYQAIAGRDERDATSIDQPISSPSTVEIKDKKIGVPYNFLERGISSAVLDNFKKSVKVFENLGYEIVPLDLPHLKYSLACYYIIMPAESSTNLARYDGIRYGPREAAGDLWQEYAATRGRRFGDEPRRRIMIGTFVLSSGYYDAYYRLAWRVKKIITQEFLRAFASVAAIITPTAPTTAFRLGEKRADPVEMYLADILTAPANLAGLPAISLPSGRDAAGLPFGLQIIAPPFAEDRLFKLSKEFEFHAAR